MIIHDHLVKKLLYLEEEEEEKLSQTQTELARQLNASVSIILCYERDESVPSIETAKKPANLPGSTVGYLLGETEDDQLLEDPKKRKRLKELQELSEPEKEQVCFNMDAVIREIKNRRLYSIAK